MQTSLISFNANSHFSFRIHHTELTPSLLLEFRQKAKPGRNVMKTSPTQPSMKFNLHINVKISGNNCWDFNFY